MKINYSRINNALDINKKQIQASIAPKTRKEDKDYKSLGRYIFNEMDAQDNRKPEYVNA